MESVEIPEMATIVWLSEQQATTFTFAGVRTPNAPTMETKEICTTRQAMFARTMPYQELEITHNVIACVITLNTTIRDLKSNSKMELKHKKKAKIF
jgi:hypothetical protein